MAQPVALVLGGGGGIGAAVVRRLAADHTVVIHHHTHTERAQALADEVTSAGGQAAIVSADLTTEEGAVAAFDAAEQQGELAVVVYCVGRWDFPKLTDLTVEEIDWSLGLNLRSGLLALRESARRVRDGGRVVVVSSMAATVATPRHATYSAAKAGLEAAARSAAKELGRRGVTVNVVRPGATDTDTLRETTSEKAVEAMSGQNAMRRLATPDDIAGAVAMLVAPTSGWVTGAIVEATGGL